MGGVGGGGGRGGYTLKNIILKAYLIWIDVKVRKAIPSRFIVYPISS